MSERRTVYPFVLRGTNRDFLIAMTVKATVNSTKVFGNNKKVFFSGKKKTKKNPENHNSTHIYFAATGILC
jgi:hypothetical protein